MLVSVFIGCALCRVTEIDSPTIKQVSLQNSDSISINALALDVFLSVQSYFFFGTLTVTATYQSQSQSYSIKPASRLSFSNCHLTIELAKSATTCTIGVFVTEMGQCDVRHSAHSQSLMSATATIPIGDNRFCWFFDFTPATPTFELNGPNETFSVLLPGGAAKPLVEVERLASMFVLIASQGSGEVGFSTKQSYCDWNERDGPFQACTIEGCRETPLDFSRSLQSDRTVKRWVWLCVYGLAAVLFVLCGVLVFLPVGVRSLFGLPSRPLLSDGQYQAVL
jgi:hypothetical protein